jgi:multiple sugar transport system permease protein
MPRANLSPSRRLESRWALFFLSPWLIGFLLFTLGPMIASLVFSFSNFSLIGGRLEFIGLGNYVKLLSADPKFWKAMSVTFTFAFIAVPLTLVAGFLLAYILNLKIPGTNFWRTIFYMPSIISGVVVAILWRGLFDERYGFINWAIGLFGIRGPDWFLSQRWALGALVIISLWGVGGGMIIYLAGLQGIPTQFYEAAELDGCNRLQRLRHVTLPMMSNIIFYNLIMGIISCFQYFTEAWTLTRGGPADATLFYNIYIYKTAFSYQEMGYGSALAWVLFFIVLILSALAFKSSSMWVYYEGEVKR